MTDSLPLDSPAAETSAASEARPPFVSVIVPVYNDPDGIGECLRALVNQTYPRADYEIIVVDNGSTDRTPEVVQGFPVRYVTATTERSSYVARNAGVRVARGEVLAFTDADCLPTADWLAAGVAAVTGGGAALAGGSVRFTFSGPPTGAELFDSVTNMQVERNVRERGVAKTANLFARAAVFDRVGVFPETRSGGDVGWTSRASASGFELVYAPDAEVRHPARRLRDLVAKQYRVGMGQPALWGGAETRSLLRFVAGSVAFLLAADAPSELRRRLRDRGVRLSRARLARTVLAGYAVRLATVAGNVVGFVQLRRSRH